MHGLAEYEVLQPHEEIQREAATQHPAVTARTEGETRPLRGAGPELGARPIPRYGELPGKRLRNIE